MLLLHCLSLCIPATEILRWGWGWVGVKVILKTLELNFVIISFHKHPLLQENGNGEEILNTLKYVRPGNGFEPKFPVFEKLEVNGEKTHPIFKFLKDRLPIPSDDSISFMSAPGKILWAPVARNDIAWNFEKFLIAPDGKPFRRYSRHYIMTNIQSDIKKLIDQFQVK